MFEHIRAFPVVYVATVEPLRAVRDIAGAWNKQYPVFVWDVNTGMRTFDQWASGIGQSRETAPMAALAALGQKQGAAIMIALNLHRFWSNPQVLQALLDGVRAWSATGKRLVIVGPPSPEVPVEIQRYVVVIDHALPDEKALRSILLGNIEANNLQMGEGDVGKIVNAGRGLTAFEFTNAIALSIALHGRVRVEDVMAQKEQMVRKNAALRVIRSPFTFADVGGLDNLKDYLRRVAFHPLFRGVLLTGVPGCGKTMIAAALGNELGVPVLRLEPGGIFGSRVGESEQRLAAALQVVEAMAPCVLVIDEIEKILGGARSSHQSDAGTAARVLGIVLQWLEGRSAQDIAVVATSNNVNVLPPEVTRSGRWDAMFFVDVPTAQERVQIGNVHSTRYKVPLAETDFAAASWEGWTGAEIEQVIRTAAMMGIPIQDARRFVTPLVQTRADEIQSLRAWAGGTCIPASLSQAQKPVDLAEAARTVL